jgi:hypothetical protein
MDLKHTEFELKFDASNVDTSPFVQWAMAQGPTKYIHAKGPDEYYEQGTNVVRHRWFAGKGGEITVKRRKDANCITERQEIDLKFDESTMIWDITAFLTASGWVKTLTLNKDAHIFWYNVNEVDVTIALYSVGLLQDGDLVEQKRFLEVEIEKHMDLNTEEALKTLSWWKARLNSSFSLSKPVNLSLYEMYSGKKYNTL